ncbi:MAG: ABC transporter substrate-binding protein [Myxococcales bacterium]|nr:ABC transporter substrate-binding protein [Myxococcales bacterium]
MTLGLYCSLTGSQADFGIATRRGVELAVDALNAQGGLLGHPVRLAVADTRGDSGEAASAVTRLIDNDGATVVVGEIASALSLAGARVCQRKRVPMITPSSTSPDVTRVGDHVFRVCFIDPWQGEVMARFARNTLHLDRVAIFKDQGSPYSVGLAEAFQRSFTALGGSVVDTQAYRAGDTHFSAQLTSLLGHQPQGLFVPGYYQEVALIAREARGQGFQGRFLGGDGWDAPSLTQIDDNRLVGDFFSEGFAPEGATNPVAQDFVRKFRERYHTDPNGLAALGYDAAVVAFDAIRRAGSNDGAAVRAALASTRNVPGATGSITLNENRDAVKSAVILEVREDAFRYRETINPG